MAASPPHRSCPRGCWPLVAAALAADPGWPACKQTCQHACLGTRGIGIHGINCLKDGWPQNVAAPGWPACMQTCQHACLGTRGIGILGMSCLKDGWPQNVAAPDIWTAHVRVTQSWHTGDTCEGDRREGVTQLHMAGLHMCTLVLRGLHVLVVPARAAAPG
eukprot:1157126-Pelagomonas_calceolata.AAC.8